MKNNKFLEFVLYCYHRHDVECNQKYGDNLPYSFHLKMVQDQADKFIHLVEQTLKYISGPPSIEPVYSKEREWVMAAIAGHDLIEDARVSYNDIKGRVGVEVADIIFLCTEMRGRDRAERKSDEFYKQLAENELAVFVKLCDIMANSLYSVSTNSSMLKKQMEEWPKIKERLSKHTMGKFIEMAQYLDKIYTLAPRICKLQNDCVCPSGPCLA